MKKLFLLVGIFIFAAAIIAQDFTHETKAQHDKRMEWWRNARFGLFIHWGLYSIPAGEWDGKTNYAEWIRNQAEIPIDVYDKFVSQFNPVKFDADRWVKMAKNAGMKYIVITSKHHDGFSLFDSKYTDFDVMSTPFHLDILKELSQACKKEGIKLCFYYSIMDWHNPDYLPRRAWETNRSTKGADFDRYVLYMKNQLKELLTNYGNIGVLWFDGEWENTWNDKRGLDLYNYVRSLQPNIIINNRVGASRSGMEGFTKGEGIAGDFGTPEQQIPSTGLPGVDWESCMTMNDHWGYNKNDKNFKSTKEILQMLADIASKGGNYLLNVGPTSQGLFPPESIDRLQEIGKWMKINGESIYGTSASPFKKLDWGRCTQKMIDGNTRLYLHVFDWPEDGKLVVPGIYNKPVRAYLLADKNETLLSYQKNEDAIVISVPSTAPDSINSVVVLDISGKADINNPPDFASDNKIFINSMEVQLKSIRDNTDLRYTLDGSTPEANSMLYSGPIQLKETTLISARCFKNGNPVSGTSKELFNKVIPEKSIEIENAVNGIRYKYFEGSWDSLPDFNSLKPLDENIIPNFSISSAKSADHFGYEYYGYIKIPVDGIYTLYISSDDGSRLYIGEKLIVDNDGEHGIVEKSSTIALSKGFHAIKVDFFERTGDQSLGVKIKSLNLEKESVPDSLLFYTNQ
ncbi:MAG: alpha-L-fucosidase [Ignavibacteriaceae bacterium]